MDKDEYEEYLEDKKRRMSAMMDNERFLGCDGGFDDE